ncbi:hypothetical protein ABZ896_37375 [Streptomyces sp. NPDC047072]|uniref:effector-associated constant component EACC1 n=1 Tax=Streptomyces sp. NPDC047072 TaxID=3154809 RepID=UPI0033D51125
MSDVRIVVEGSSAAFESLWDWLRQEPGLRGRIRHLAPAAGPGTMGSLSQLAVESLVTGTISAVIGVLSQSLATWLQQRRSRGDAPVSVVVMVSGGQTLRFDVQSPAEIERLLRAATAPASRAGEV